MIMSIITIIILTVVQDASLMHHSLTFPDGELLVSGEDEEQQSGIIGPQSVNHRSLTYTHRAYLNLVRKLKFDYLDCILGKE
mmetsp:Transcript_3602/g.5233  ORF Transcript_3602/g.5233 Transcript_3602/m.5233 type:complete len:82 (+) Transcript_3602:519-764(+)